MLIKMLFEHLLYINEILVTSVQDGGIGTYALIPHTMKRRTTTKLKTKTNQNCQKIKLYGSPTTKELKKKHSYRLVGGAEMGSQDKEDTKQSDRPGWDRRQLVDQWSYTCMQISWEEQLGVRQTTQPRVPVQATKASKPLAVRGIEIKNKLAITKGERGEG